MFKSDDVEKVEFTHVGWFGICPILLGEIDEFAPVLHERWAVLLPLLIFSEFVAGLIISFKSKSNPDYVPQFPVHHVKELKQPIIKEFKVYKGNN